MSLLTGTAVPIVRSVIDSMTGPRRGVSRRGSLLAFVALFVTREKQW